MTDDGSHPLVPHRTHQSKNIAHSVQTRIRQKIVIQRNRSCRTASVAAQIRRNHMKTRLRQRQQLISPAVRQLRKAMQKHNTGLTGSLETSLQNVHLDAVMVIDSPRTDP